MNVDGFFTGISMVNTWVIMAYVYMSHRKKKNGNTKYVLAGHWLMEIDGNC
jgi:hypothetical protein